MNALVTGAAGFIGSHLVATLLDEGARVTGVDAFTDYYARSIKESNLDVNRGREGFTFVEGRLQDLDLGELLHGVTHVFHLAAQAGVRKSWGRDFRVYTDNNVDATQQLLESCVGRPLQIRREPAQKGDMRDTYADTALARADLGFAPAVTLEQGLESEYRWLSTVPALP